MPEPESRETEVTTDFNPQTPPHEPLTKSFIAPAPVDPQQARTVDFSQSAIGKVDNHLTLPSATGSQPDIDTSGGIDRPLPIVPGFDLIREVGRGGMGVVYQAHALSLNRNVALKMLMKDTFASAEDLIRFRLEAEVAARIQHPNVVQVFESGTTNGQSYLVLEWVDGGTLSDFVRKKSLPYHTAARMVSLLARATHAAHSNGVVHRDLKPSNVLLARAENQSKMTLDSASPSVTLEAKGKTVQVIPKLADFGLAKLMTGPTDLTQTGRIMGTPEYMAPEQAEGKNKIVGPAADIHSLGVILYQAVTGTTPFHAENTLAVLRRVKDDEPKTLRSITPKTPRDLETICLKCLRKNPFQRYATAADLADDLDAFLANRPISARPVGPAERAWKWALRNPAVSALSALAVLLLVGGFIGISLALNRANNEKDRAEKAEIVARKEAATAKAVNRFLIEDMLAAANPEKAQGRVISVAEVLADAAAQCEGAFPDQPEVEASVRFAIGRCFYGLGKYTEAEPHLRYAKDTRLKLLGPNHAETLRAKGLWGMTLEENNNWTEGEKTLREVVADAKAKLGANHEVTLEMQSFLGLALNSHDRVEEAEKVLKELINNHEENHGATDIAMARTMNDLGVVLYTAKKYEEAETILLKAIKLRQVIRGPNHPDTLETMNNLAAVYQSTNKNDESQRLFQDVVTASEKVRGPNHSDTISSISNLGKHYQNTRQFDKAKDAYEDCLKRLAISYPAGNALTWKVQHNLATVYYSQRNYEDAKKLFLQVMAARRKNFPPDHADLLQVINDLAITYAFLQQQEQAADLLEEKLKLERMKFGKDSPEVMTTARIFGATCGASKTTIGRVNVALTQVWKDSPETKSRSKPDGLQVGLLLLKQALQQADLETAEIIEKELATARTKATPRDAYQNCIQVAPLFFQLAKNEKSLLHAEEAIKHAKAVSENFKLQLIDALTLSTRLTLAMSDTDKAEVYAKELYDTRKALKVGNTDMGNAAFYLGQCYTMQKKYEVAEPLLLEAWEKLNFAPKELKDRTKIVIVEMYTNWKKPEKAKEWTEKK